MVTTSELLPQPSTPRMGTLLRAFEGEERNFDSQRMAEIIEGLRGKVAILLIEHDMDAVFRLADRLTVMVEGAVIAAGTAAEISANEAVKLAYLGGEE